MRQCNGHLGIVGTWLVGLVLVGCSLWARSARGADPTEGEEVPTVWAHCPYVVQRAVTNRTAAARTVAKVMTSCACLTAEIVGRTGETPVPSGGVLPFVLTLNPAGMEGRITKTASVTFDDGSVETMVVEADVRTRLKLSPSDAAFGVIGPKDLGRTVTANLTGEIAERSKVVGVKGPEHPFFDVAVAEDGKGLEVRFRDGGGAFGDRPLPGGHVETWIVRTDDDEIPEIAFPVSVTIAGDVAVSPQVLTVSANEGVCSRMVTLRGKKAFTVQGARTMPRKWGEVKVEKRPLNGWMIRVSEIDPNELRQFSKRPYLLVRTDCPEMESFEIPMRMAQKGTE